MAPQKPAALKKVVKYHNDGTVWARGTTRGGVMEGRWTWFRKSGTRMRSGFFTRGKQSGRWTTYDRKGKAFKVTNFG